MSAPLTRAQVHQAALEAAYQVESLGAVLVRLAPEAPNGGLLDESLIRCFGLRLQALAGSLMEFADFGDRVPEADQLKHAVIEVFGELPDAEGGDE